MYVSEVNNYHSRNINFGAGFFEVVKFTRSKEAVVQLHGELPSRVVAMVSGIKKVHESLRKLMVQKANPEAQNCLEVLRAKHGFREVFETPSDGIAFVGNDGKNWIVSSHGVNSLRVREQDSQTGEIVSSLFIHDRKIVKNDTRHEIPEKFEYLKHEDIGYQFADELQTKLDDSDFALLKVRRALDSPVFRAEISKVEPAQMLSVNIKTKAAPVEVTETPVVEPRAVSADVVEEPIVAQPVAAVKPVVKKEMGAERIALINSLLRGDKPKKVAEEIVEVAPAKRRGRPKGSVNKVKKEKTVAPTAPKPEAEKLVQVAPKEKVKVQKIKKPVVPNLLSDNEMSLLSEIETEFKRAYTTLFSGSVSESTRTAIRNGYGERLVKNSSNSRHLTFVGLGNNGENVGVNVFNTKDGDFYHIRLIDENDIPVNLIINSEGKAVRRSSLVNDRYADQFLSERRNNTYTREELDNLDLVPILTRLKSELGNYNSYLDERFDKTKAWRISHFGNPKLKRVILSDEELSLVSGVKSLFEEIYKTLNSIEMAANTRTNIKYGYGDRLLKDSSRSRILNFAGLGKDGANVGVNVVSYQNTEFLHVRITDAKSGLDKNFIINPQGIIKKSAGAVNTSVAPRVLGDENFYRREEIDDLEFIPTLKKLKDELVEYHSYVEKRVEKASSFKASHGRRCDAPVTFAKPAEAASDLTPQEMIKFIQEQVNQVRIELNKNLRLMMAEITSAVSQSFRTFGETANSKLNELQENLMKFVEKK